MFTYLPGILGRWLRATSQFEPRPVLQLWSALAGVSAAPRRGVSLEFGTGNIYPNLYVVFLGTPGSRKSTAIKLFAGVMREAGFVNIAADKTSKEQFLEDLHASTKITEDDPELDPLSIDLTAPMEGLYPESFIAADELVDFVNGSPYEFCAMLGTLWDATHYKSRFKTKAVHLNCPSVTLLSGSTPETWNKLFPAEEQGQGFLSRVITIKAPPVLQKVAFPKPIPAATRAQIVADFRALMLYSPGVIRLDSAAEALATDIYDSAEGCADPRFQYYNTRRHTHLLKLACSFTIADLAPTISRTHILLANTLLVHAETYMGEAVGQFGKAWDSDTSHRIVEYIGGQKHPPNLGQLYEVFAKDVKSAEDLERIVHSLELAKKIIRNRTVYKVAPTKQVKNVNPAHLHLEFKRELDLS